jgi:uncharacterized protein
VYITFDPAKQAKTLAERGLDFNDAAAVFEQVVVESEDTRTDYGEKRYITVGMLNSRLVVMVWTPRFTANNTACCHVISMRKANEREQKRYRAENAPSSPRH